MNANKRITIKDVAAHAGVSPATVSRVLNDYKWINESVRQRVLESVETLHFVPNYSATTMVRGTSRMVVVVVPVIDNPFFTTLINTVVQELKKKEYYTMIYTTENELEEQSFLNSSFCLMADGIVDATSITAVEKFDRVRVPLVLVDRSFPNNSSVSCVSNNNQQALYQMVSYLVAHGHQNIAFLTGEDGIGIAHDKFSGYKDALSHFGIPYRSEYFIQDTWRLETGIYGTQKLLALDHPPSAIIAGNNFLCKGVLEELKARSLVPGKDISLLGFEESESDRLYFSKKNVSTMRIDTDGIARRAVEILLSLIQEKTHQPVFEQFQLFFHERSSVVSLH